MGFKVEIRGQNYEVTGFSVEEAATPLAAGDSSGQIGTLSFTIPMPDLYDRELSDIGIFGPQILHGADVELSDTRKGFTIGSVRSIARSESGGTYTIQCESRLGLLNVYNIQAQPFVGTLRDLFTYYMSLANVDSGILIDDSIADQEVVFPGWDGELWFHLKQVAAALDCDVSLVSGVIVLRPIRDREATRGRDLDRSMSAGSTQLAQAVEVYKYNHREIHSELVYPPGGWNEEVSVINVNAGETVEEVIELSASVSSIDQPEMQTFVSRAHDSSSVFTVVGDDGLPITPEAWEARGGKLSVSINPDTISLTVKVKAPTGLPSKDGEEIGVYGIALSADESTGRYSTLRIIGSGVAFDKELKRIPTGVEPSQTATEVGATIDNLFISNSEQLYTTGTRAAREYTGRTMSIDGSVTAINQLGDTGDVTYPTYRYDQDLHEGKTYGQVQDEYEGQSYWDILQDYYLAVRDQFENQVFGNVNGARIWDRLSRRWYRIRSASLTPAGIEFQADNDLTFDDVQGYYEGHTYGEVQDVNEGRTYGFVDLAGLYGFEYVAPSGDIPYPSPNLYPSPSLYPVSA